MESAYLKKLSEFLQTCRYVLLYGAGGVTGDLLCLLDPYLCKEKICIVVSDQKENQSVLKGYPVKKISEFCSMQKEVYVIISAAPRYVGQMEESLKAQGFLHYCTASYLVDRIYEEIWKTPIKKNKIVLGNGDAYGFGGNPKYIALELMKSEKKLDLVWITGDGDPGLPKGIRRVSYGTYEHYYELGTAQIWVDNQHKNFHTRKRNGQIYIQTWHGGGPLKKIEFDAEGLSDTYLDLCERNSEMEDLLISPSEFNSSLYRRAFHYQGEILECGYPRNDLFWESRERQVRIKKLFGVKPQEGILLFAPTYREFAVKKEDILDLIRVQKALERRFGRAYRVFVRFHPFDKEPEKKYTWHGEWTNVTACHDVQELLVAADILITDYSSIMWDFSLQRKPVFLFHPDLDRYEKERGYYLPFKSMPYMEVFSNEEICQKIEEFQEGRYQEALSRFLQDYGSFYRGTASKAVTERILKIIEE